MKRPRLTRPFVSALLALACCPALWPLAPARAAAGGNRPASAEWVTLETNQQRFVLAPSQTRITPWGFNYDRDYRMRLLEEYWDHEWDTVTNDFREMQALGANVVRVHLQFAHFMDAPDRPRQASLDRLEQLLSFCDTLPLYLDLTGLACYRKKDVPGWYDALTEAQRWQAQANFWRAIARRGAPHRSIFAYDLMNEPMVPAKPLGRGAWLHPFALGGFHYVQSIALDPANRDRAAIARAWTRQLASAIREADRRHLITVGLLPNSLPDPGKDSGFAPAAIAPEVDYLSVHLYPASGKVEETLRTLRGFCVGKPVVIEEMFPLHCSAEELGQFIQQSKPDASGWIGFYWGQTPTELRESAKLPDILTRAWLELFQKMKPVQ